MSIYSLPLRKLIQLMYAEPNLRTRKLREDIRNEIGRDNGDGGGGPDFFSPFWRAAKGNVFGTEDLSQAVQIQVEANSNRARLYPLLRDGFLLWWNERRRWTNEPFVPASSLKGAHVNVGLGLTAKIENILAVQDGNDENHFIYPYFCEAPLLSTEGARIGLWMMINAFPNVPTEDLRLLDVMRGENYSLERVPLQGNEFEMLTTRFQFLVSEWDRLREQYD